MVNSIAEPLESWGPVTHCFTMPDLVFTIQENAIPSPPSFLRGHIGRQEASPLLGQIAQGHGQSEYPL